MATKRSGIDVTRACLYLRVSTGDQAQSGLGLADQERRCRAYCEERGWPVAAVYSDEGASGASLARAQLDAALGDLAPGTALVFLKLDRLTRSVMDLGRLTEQVEAKGAAWASVCEQFDTSTATGRLLLRLIVELAQWERELIAERTQDALREKRARGEYVGGVPTGYRWNPEGDGLQVDPATMAAVRRAQELRARKGRKRLSLRAIAAVLEEEGYPTQKGGRWQAQTVKNILGERAVERRGA